MYAGHVLPIAALMLTLLAACRSADDTTAGTDAAGRTSAVSSGTVDVDYDAVASTLIGSSVGVKEGDIVVISGSPRDLALLENLAVEARRAGAHPLVSLNTDRMSRKMYDDVPAKYDSQPPVLDRKLVEMSNVFVLVDASEDSKTLAGVPAERTAARAKAMSPVTQMAFKRGIRTVEVGNNLYPTAERAQRFQMSRDALASMFWDGVNVSPDTLHARGEALRSALAGAKEVRITHPNGTDLTVNVTGRRAFVNDGRIDAADAAPGTGGTSVYLPAGEVYVTPVPGTARGTVVIDNESYQGKEMRGLKLVFANGKVTEMSAESGNIHWKPLFDAASGGKDELAFIDIGINPKVKAAEGARLLTWVAEGMVSIGLGSNIWAGGTNNSPFATSHFLPGCTVTVDGTAIVENGALKPK